MKFAQLPWLNLFWLIAGLGAFLWWAFRYKETKMQHFAQAHLLNDIAKSRYKKRELFKTFLLMGVFVFAVLALARPQWGFQWQEVKRQGLDLIIAIDTSRSMLTEDVKPNRLERAKLAVKDLIVKLRGDRIGLVAFSGSSFLTCPLTVDYGGFLLALEDLGPYTVSQGGTSLETAIYEGIKGYEKIPSQYKALIIITDGENLQGDPLRAAKKAKEKGIKIFCIGIGTPEGELIRVPTEKGEYEFLKDKEGNFVKSRLEEQVLKDLALETNGAYVRATGAQFGLDYLYETRLSKMEKRDIEEKMRKQYTERFQFPLALGLLLLVIESVISTRRKI